MAEVWTLAVRGLSVSPFKYEPRRTATRFKGDLFLDGEFDRSFWGHTRRQVVTQARRYKAERLARADEVAKVEMIEL